MTSENISVRKGTEHDVAAIVAFQQGMALETEGKRLDQERLTRGVRGVFQSDGRGFYLIAEAEGRPVGGLLVTYEWSDWRNGTFWWIQSVYVTAEWRRRGVYRALYRHVQNAARENGACGIRLYVESANRVAQQVYANLGMSKSHYDMYEVDFVL